MAATRDALQAALGPYHAIERALGRGSLATVLLARGPRTGRMSTARERAA